MSNEELVKRLQNGDESAIPALWEQVQGFAKKQALKLKPYIKQCGVEFDELIDAGCLAMIEAAKKYDESSGATFISWYAFFLKNEFATACGYRSRKRNALSEAVSLSVPISDDGTLTLEESIPDPNDCIESVTDAINREQLRATLETIVATLPREERETIYQHYLQEVPLDAVNVTGDKTPRQYKNTGLNRLRSRTMGTRLGAVLRSFSDSLEDLTPYYMSVGARRFQNTHTSSVEAAAIVRDRLEKQIAKDSAWHLAPQERAILAAFRSGSEGELDALVNEYLKPHRKIDKG